MSAKSFLFAAGVAILVQPGFVFGDGDRPASGARPAATPNQASDASFDKRLPPVLPGEEVNDSGRTMKVWSTAGPVPVSTAPEPGRCGRAGCGAGLGDIDVVIDGRGFKRGPFHEGEGTQAIPERAPKMQPPPQAMSRTSR